jgi:hypothetical protein
MKVASSLRPATGSRRPELMYCDGAVIQCGFAICSQIVGFNPDAGAFNHIERRRIRLLQSVRVCEIK